MRLTIVGSRRRVRLRRPVQHLLHGRDRARHPAASIAARPRWSRSRRAASIPTRIDGIDPSAICTAIISAALPFLLLDAQFLSRRERPLTIAGPPGTRDAARRRAARCSFRARPATNWRFPLEVVEIAPGAPAEVLGIAVTTAEVVHQSGAPSTAVRLSDGEQAVRLFRRHRMDRRADRRSPTAPISSSSNATTIAVPVTGHISWAVLKQNLPELRARRIMITHMNPTMLAHIEEAKRLGLLVAEDGLVLEI